MINAAGVLADGVYSNDTEYSRDWDAVWDGRAHSALGEPRTIDQAALRAEPAAIETEPNYETGTFNVNVVMRWEYRLGSTLFVVYTHRQTDEITPSGGARAGLRFPLIKPRAASDILLVKLSYWWG